mgnify:CR=1 FL=1
MNESIVQLQLRLLKEKVAFIVGDGTNKSQVDYSELIKTVKEILESKGLVVTVK